MSSADDTAAPADEEEDAAIVETDELREGLLETLRTELGDAVVDSHIRPGDDLWVRVTRESWREAGVVLRDKLGCRHFTFLSAIDWLPSPYGRYLDTEAGKEAGEEEPTEPAPVETGCAGGETRFQVFARAAHIRNDPHYFGVTLKVDLPDDDLRIASWRPVYAGADWHERETWEMFGITFEGHPYLEHIYLPGHFEGHPLRKDFPLLARVVKPWPGIVDVEPMPETDEGDEGDAGAGEGEGGDTTGSGSSAADGGGEGGGS